MLVVLRLRACALHVFLLRVQRACARALRARRVSSAGRFRRRVPIRSAGQLGVDEGLKFGFGVGGVGMIRRKGGFSRGIFLVVGVGLG